MTSDPAPFRRVRACAFDAYGTLFDVHSAIREVAAAVPDSQQLSELWRAKQLQYTWLRSLMGKYADFERVTREALEFALRTHGVRDRELQAALLERYLHLDAYEDAREAIVRLRQVDLTVIILSNGTPAMIEAACESSGLGEVLQGFVSVDDARVYKPHPDAYTLACDGLGLEPEEICLISANGWDVAGGGSFGFRTVWVNRSPGPAEQLGAMPDAEVRSLADAATAILDSLR